METAMSPRSDAPYDQVIALDPRPDGPPQALRSRRSLIAAGLGGLAGAVAAALGRPGSADAAAGDALKLGETNYAGSAATRLNTTSSGGAFWMTQYGSGSGVRGEATIGTGGIFLTSAPNHNALVGEHTGTSGTGAAVRADGGNNVGVYASTDVATYAMYGVSPAPGATVVGGISLATTGSGIGVKGLSQSSEGIGVSGEGGGTGVSGTTLAAAGVGVYGEGPSTGVSARALGTSAYGVFAWASAATGTTYGIWTQVNSASGWALWAVGDCKVNGDLDVTGSVTAPATAAVLAHPIDPAGRRLRQESVLSSDRLVMQSGTATADHSGRATVQLPRWFEAIAGEPRYHLTPIGAFAPLFVEATLAGGSFGIGGAQPGQAISWQVTGNRRDAWARSHALVVEEASANG
jgi:hypothetical protein